MLKHGRPNTSARTRRNPPRPDCSGACTAGILAQPFGRPLLLFCFHTNSPKFVCAWSVALHTHAPAETNRAGHWQNTSARTRERAGSIPLGPSDPITPPPPLHLLRRYQDRPTTATGLALRIEPAPRYSCSDLRMDEGSSPCVAPPSSLHPVATSALPPFFPARRAITVLPPPRGPRSVCIRAVPSVAFSSTASDVLHAWPRCSRAVHL
jgi:hypothetical protein